MVGNKDLEREKKMKTDSVSILMSCICFLEQCDIKARKNCYCKKIRVVRLTFFV